MKILLASDWYPPVVNGVVTSVVNLRRELLLRGHDVRVLTLSRSTHSFSGDGVTYIGSFGAGKIYPEARLKTLLAGRCVQDIIAWGPDIIHTQCEFSTFFMARKIASRLTVPIVHTYHTVYEDYTHYFSPNRRWGRRMAESFSRWALNRTSCVITPTEKIRALLEGYGVAPEIRVIPTGIDLGRFTDKVPPEKRAELKAGLGIPLSRPVLLFVGRLAREKNLEEILTYFSKLPSGSAALLVAGDGPHRADLEQLARHLGIEESVVFTGMVAPAEIAGYYGMSDLFVSASGSETQGLTTIEALASGLPCLCRRDPCLDGVIIDGLNGWQYAGENEFFGKLDLFLGSTGLREALSRGASDSALKFSASVFAEKVEAAYEYALKTAAPAGVPRAPAL